jgi:hypothetical protein
MVVWLPGGAVDEHVGERFRQRIKKSQPRYPQVKALAEILRLTGFSDEDLVDESEASVGPMSDRDFEVLSGTIILLLVAARAPHVSRSSRPRSPDADVTKAARPRAQLEDVHQATAQREKPQRPPAMGLEQRKIFARYSEVAERTAQGVARASRQDPAHPAALTRAQALTNLAALFPRAHDNHPAKSRLEEAAGWLETLGWPYRGKADLDAAFSSWAGNAPSPEPGRPYDQRFLRLVTAVLGMWGSTLMTRPGVPGDDDGSISKFIIGLGGYAGEFLAPGRSGAEITSPVGKDYRTVNSLHGAANAGQSFHIWLSYS